MERTMKQMMIVVMVAIVSGCASSSIYFRKPVGSRMTIKNNQYTLPVVVDLPQTDDPASLRSDLDGKPLIFILPDGTRLKGFIYVYKINMDQLEKLAEVTFELSQEQITKLKNGYAVTVTGYSARKRPVYKINLGLDR
jgi:hypothetical protein